MTDRPHDRSAAAPAPGCIRQLFEEHPDAVMVIGPDFRVTYQNRRHLADWGDHRGEHCHQTFQDRAQPCSGCPASIALKGGTLHRSTPEACRNGVHLEVTASPLRDEAGGVAGALVMLRDRTEQVAAEQDRTARAQRLVLHAAQTPLAYVEFTPDGQISEWNPAAQRLFGFSREEALGRDALELIVPEDVRPHVQRLFETLGRSVPSEEGLRSENANLDKAGRRLVCEWYNAPLRDESGRVVAIGSMVQDVTSRVQTAQALARSEARLRAIFDHSIDGIGVARQGLIQLVNGTFVRMFGYERPDELVGRPILDIIAPEYRDVAADRVRRRFAGDPVGPSLDTRGLRRDGSTFDLQVEATSFTQDGEVHALSFLRDTTAATQARRDLEDRERRFRALIECSHDVVTVIDQRGQVAYHSPSYERVMGHRPADRAGHSMMELVHPDDLPAIRAAFGRILPTPGHTERLTMRSRHADGSWRWIEVVATNHLDDPAVGGIVVNHRDVTEERRAAEERERLERQMQHVQKLESLGVLAGGIAHDFNNILMGVLGHAGLALSELSPLSPVRDHLTEIENAARRAAELTQQMLAYSGKGRFVVQPVDLRELVVELTHMLEVSISKKATLRLQLGDQVPPVMADASQMRQVLMNLVINASEAIGEQPGVIAVSLGSMRCDQAYLSSAYLDEKLPPGDYVFLEVADTGCGMDPETQARIFEPFFSTKFTGRGLGLAAVLGIVRGHRGAIRVLSEPGRGTTFKMVFPVAEQAAPARPPAPDPHWKGRGTVLLVDDEESVRLVGRKMLQRLGLSVLTAENGRAALEVFAEHRTEIDCVLLDLTMPQMDGEETFRELRRQRGDLPVLLSSGYAEAEVNQRFAGLGLAGVVQKPYNLAELARRLRPLLPPQETSAPAA